MPSPNKVCETKGTLLSITSYDTVREESSETVFIHYRNLKIKHLLANTLRQNQSILLLDINDNVICEFADSQTPQNFFDEKYKCGDILEPLIDFLAQK